MEFWVACILFLISIACVVLFAIRAKGSSKNVLYIVGIVCFSVTALVSAGYMALTFLLLGGIS